jgi:hypothetical protein
VKPDRVISYEEFNRMVADSVGPVIPIPSGSETVMVSKPSLGALIAGVREKVGAGESSLMIQLAGLLCKRAMFADDAAEALRFGNEALALLRARGREGDEDAAMLADIMLNEVPELGVA